MRNHYINRYMRIIYSPHKSIQQSSFISFSAISIYKSLGAYKVSSVWQIAFRVLITLVSTKEYAEYVSDEQVW